MENKQTPQRELKINVPTGHVPVYANSVQISVSNEEVTLQFLFVRPNTDHGLLVSEVVITPNHAMKLQKALDETVKKHFTKHIK